MQYKSYKTVPQDRLTPMLQQYVTIKHKHCPQALLLFKVGDFLEAFFEDAVTIASALDLVLTSKMAGEQIERVPLAGIPTHALDRYAGNLARQGWMIVVCNKTEDCQAQSSPPIWQIVKCIEAQSA